MSLHLFAGALFIFYVCLEYRGVRNGLAVKILAIVAVSEFLAVAVGALHDRIDAEKAKARDEQLIAAQKTVAQLVERAKDRRLSDADKTDWLATLSEFRGQQFKIIQVGAANYEAANFAKDIARALGNCGWNGRMHLHVDDPENFKIFSGVALFLGHPEPGKTGWPTEAAKALGVLFERVRASGILEGGAFAAPFLQNGEIGIVIGQKG